MKARQKNEVKKPFSARSQRSVLKQLELEAEQQKFRDRIAFAERRIAEAKARSHSQARSALNSFPITQSLARTLEEIASREREVTCYQERIAALQTEIDALEPTAQQARERAGHQSALLELAHERLEKDREADAELQKLRDILRQRAALTAAMAEIAPLIDFEPNADFDAGRFAELLYSLPAELAEASQQWFLWFSGQEKNKAAHTIGAHAFVLPETLANLNVFRPGSVALLTKAQAEKLPSGAAAKPLPGPVEMEEAAGNSMRPAAQNTGVADDFPVTGFIGR